MVHSFNSLSTPSVPSPPLSTPSAALSKSQQARLKPNFPRAPVQNPFDKFTQSAYDAWIGKLTGDLEKALGYDEVVPPQDDALPITATAPRVGSVVTEPTQEFEDDLEGDSVVEDSFADVKARRASKGKARDPREGPGLGPKSGDQNQPIEILSDEEDEQDSSHVLGSEGSEEEEAEGGYNEGEFEYEEEDEEEEGQVGTSTRAKEQWNRKGQAEEAESDEGEDYDEEYDEEDSETPAAGREGSEEDVIELLSDTEPSPRAAKRQQEDEDQFLSDEELADTRSSPPQFNDQIDDLRSSPAQPDEGAKGEEPYGEKQDGDDVQPSDEDTSFPPHNKEQPTTADTLVDIRDPWSQVERYAEDYYAGGDVILHANKKGLLSAHYLGVRDNDSAIGFLSPDVVSNVDPGNSNEEEGEEGEQEFRNGDERDEDEDEEFDEGIEERNYDDMVEEDPREQETEEIDEEDHLFNRLQSSYARRPFETSYFREFRFLGRNLKSGPGTTEEPIMIDSDDDDEETAPPRPRPVDSVSVPQSQFEPEHYAEREQASEKEKEGGGDGLVDADKQRQELTGDEFLGKKDYNSAQRLHVEDTIEKIPGESKLSDEVVVDVQAGKVEPVGGHISEGAVQPTPSTVDVQTRQVVQGSASTTRPFSSDSFQNESSAAEPIVEEFFSLGRDVAMSVAGEVQTIRQLVSENAVDWTVTLDFPTSFPLAQQQLLSETAGHLEVPNPLAVPIVAATDMSTELQTINTANVDAQVFGFEEVVGVPCQQTVVHEMQAQIVDRKDGDNDDGIVEHVEELEERKDEEGRIGEEESEESEKEEVVDVEVDELDELEGGKDGNELGVLPLMTSDLEYPKDEGAERQDDPEHEGAQKQEDVALRVSTPTPFQAAAAETRVEHTGVAEVELEAAENRGEESDRKSVVQIFVEEPDDNWEGTSLAEISISVHAATPIPPSPKEPMSDRFEESPVLSRPELKKVDETVKADGGMVVDIVSVAAAASSAPREGGTVEEAIVIDDEEPRMVAVEEPIARENSTVSVEELIVEEPRTIPVEGPVTEGLSTILIEEPVTTLASPKELVQQPAPVDQDETADITITVVKMDASYDVEELLTASEHYASAGPSSRAVSLSLDLASVRSDEVIPTMEVAIGDVEEITSDVDLEPIAEQEENLAEGSPRPFSCDGDVEAQSISVETQCEVTETESTVTDVRNLQSTTPPLPGLDGEMKIHDHVPYVPAEESSITVNADDAYAASHTHTLPAISTADDNADGYFAQPGSPVMEHYGSMDFNLIPTQTSFPRSPNRSGALPTIIQLPGTPQKVLSPGGTPQLGPTPVSIAVDPVVLKALKTNPGLFSPPATVPTSQEQEQPSTPSTSVVEAASENVPFVTTATPESIVNAEIVEEVSGASIVAQESSLDISQSPIEAPVEEPAQEPESNGTPSLRTLQTLQASFLATTTQDKPTLPTLFNDPYPYSLSTPGPHNEAEGSGEEESTEQENSISTTTSASTSSSSAAAEKSPSSSAARGDRQDKEVVFSHDADNVEDHSPPSEITIPAEAAVVSTTNTEVDRALEDVEKGLVDAEAEADKLINEFLVGEPDTDTDADGEADPEFAGVASERVSADTSEEIVIQEVDEEVASAPHESDDDAAVAAADIIVNGEAVEQPMKQEKQEAEPKQSEAQSIEEVADKRDIEVEKVIDRPAALEEEDPFKLMGNDGLVAPRESDAEESEEAGESQDEPGFSASSAEPENVQQQPQQTSLQAEFSPVEVSVAPLMPQILPPSGSISSSGYVGAVPYHVAATAYAQALSSPLPHQWADRPAPNLLSLDVAPTNSLRRNASEPAAISTAEQADAAVPAGISTSDDKLPEAVSTNSKLRVEMPRKVQISVEDPYHADNDSDREQGTSALKAKKRKRSQSDVSNPEHPTTPSKVVVVPSDKGKGKGKGKGKSTPSIKTIRRKQCARRGSDRFRYPFAFLQRSPSVTSTVTSESSITTQPSPSHVLFASSEPRPFLHAHSRRKRPKAPTTMQEQLQKQRLPSASGSRPGILRAEDVLIKAPSVSSKNTSSPVTRSHCRYHKISIPKTENGPRIYFLVPGCCLNDEDLIQEEEIVDDGEAIIQGDTHIVDNIETLDFEAYLHWVLRQLVGPEILRENEVFYLPEPGEEIVRNPHRPEKRKTGKPERKRSKLAEEATIDPTKGMNPGQSPSRGSSIGSSASVLQQILESDGLSEVTETEEEKSPTKPGSKGAADIGELLTQAETGSTFSRKRSRRLGQDAAAYQPTTDSNEQSSTDFSDYNPTRRGPNRNRGQKRHRSEANVVDEVDGRKTKKSRTRPSQPQVQLGQTQPFQGELLTRPTVTLP